MKRGIVTGFDGITGKETAKRIKIWQKNQPSGRWRSVKQVRVRYTVINQTWLYGEKSFSQKYICPFGMVEYMKKLLTEQRLTQRFTVLPTAVKEAFSLATSSDYDQKNLKIECKDEGDKGYDNFYVMFCTKCSKDRFPKFIEKFKEHLPENLQIQDIQEHWDKLVAVDNTVPHELDLCGCILPNDPS